MNDDNISIKSVNKLCDILGYQKKYLEQFSINQTKYIHKYKLILNRNGKVKIRDICSPNKQYKTVLKRINKLLVFYSDEIFPNYVHGARKGRSIVTNAREHIGAEAVLSIDIKDCFPSISYDRVYCSFRNEVYFSASASNFLTSLVTVDGVLPQGFSTSSTICNLALLPMLRDLNEVCIKNKLTLTQYLDDIFISGSRETIARKRNVLLTIVYRHGFRVNHSKVAIKYKHSTITGVSVSDNLYVGKRRKRKIQREIIKYNYSRKNKKKLKPIIDGELSNVKSINARQFDKLNAKYDK